MCSGKELLKEVVHYLSLDAPSHPPLQQEQLRGTRSFQSMSLLFDGLISFSFGVVCSLPGSLSSLDLAVARFAEAETWACQKSASMSRPVPFHTFPSLGPCPCPVFFVAKDFIRITKAPGVIGHGGVEDVHRDQMEHLISLGQKYLQQAFRHNKVEKRRGCAELACLLYLSKQSMMALAELTGKKN